jgi:hypothetical protein
MKKITLLFAAMLFGSLTAFAQFTFPAEAGPVISGGPAVVVPINDAANAAGVTAGTYLSFTVTCDWENLDDAWSSEEGISVVTAGGASANFGATNGANNTNAVVGLLFEGELSALYDPSVDGLLELSITRSFTSDAQFSNIVVTITPPPTCGEATNIVATAFDTSADVSWDAPVAGTPTGYNWEVQPDGVAQGTPGALASGITAVTTVNSGVVLTASTAYEFYVQTDCDGDGTANYTTVGFLTASGPAPANDDFADAIAFACGDMNITSDTTNATLDEDDAPDGFGADNDSRNIWYSYTGSGLEEEVTIDLCASGYDTAFLVYTGTSGSLSIVGGNDDNAGQCGAGFRSYGSFTSDGTTQYFICVTGYGPANFGTIDMSISCVAATPPPANDLCSAAVELDLTVATNGTTLGATQNGTEEQPSCDGFGTIADVWYSIALTSPSDLNIVTTITGTSDQANVAVYSACGGLQADQLGCSDANGGETLAVAGLAAGTYYVRVWSDGSAARMSEANNRRTEGTFTITADATLSVGSLENENAFNYFPNPVKNELTLNAQKDIQNVAVYNMLGQEVLRTAPNSVNSTINMSELSQGAYFVQVTIGNVMETIRIIKQ